MSYRIAFFADSHIGYKTKVKSNSKGINIRLQDGYDALREVISQILAQHETEPIDAVIIGGDLFHTSRPSMRDITTVQFFLRKVAEQGIKIIILAGNHDATDIRSELAAIAPINDPDKNIYAYIDPYTQVELTDGVLLHIVSHHGLGAEDSPEVTPREGFLNLFSTHGAALDPKNKTLMQCADSPREQYIPVEMIVDDNFVAKLLGHYHSRYAVGGDSFNAWYSGSLVRRGFSDEPGARGWLLLTIDDTGHTTFVAHDIKQRPQFDLDAIDATDLTAAEVMNLLEISMDRTKNDVDKAPIVRQRILNANRGIREGLDRAKITSLAEHMLTWQLEFHRTDKDQARQSTKNISLSNKHSVNIVSSYKDWVKDVANSVPEEYRDVVVKDAENYIKEARDAGLESHTH